ncbi:MAG: hypothetical protein AVDCRST_MAG55-539, partial [uncultured Rubrobacteraceae bacterium]
GLVADRAGLRPRPAGLPPPAPPRFASPSASWAAYHVLRVQLRDDATPRQRERRGLVPERGRSVRDRPHRRLRRVRRRTRPVRRL